MPAIGDLGLGDFESKGHFMNFQRQFGHPSGAEAVPFQSRIMG
jgi:hypothetical protein